MVDERIKKCSTSLTIREPEVGSAVRSSRHTCRNAVVKGQKQRALARTWRAGGTEHCRGVRLGAAPGEKHRVESLKERRAEPSCDPATSLLGSCPKEMKSVSQREICTPVHCSLVHSRRAVETTLSFSGQMDGYGQCHAKREIIQP